MTTTIMTTTDQRPERSGNKEDWGAGSPAYFEYHCYEGHDSADAQIWYRSHQLVVVLGRNLQDEKDNGAEGMSFAERGEEGMPATYQVAHQDGYQHTATEDELITHPKFYVRPDPPCGR